MPRAILGAVLALLLFAGGAWAEVLKGTVVSYDKATMKLVVKVGDKEKTYELKKNTHVHDTDGKELAEKDRADKLKKDTKVEIEEEGGKLVEINIKK